MEKKKFIVITSGWDGMPVAYHLQNEGYDVTVGQVQDKSELKNNDPKEDSGEKESRLSQYNNILKKVPAQDLVDALKLVENKDDYFIFCDQNSLWIYAEQLVSAGFKHGLFPTKENFVFEKDREKSMAFVEEHYPGIKIIPFHEFSTVDEAKNFVFENEGVYVLQSKGDFCSTVVPVSNNPKLASDQIINQMEKNRAKYEKSGIILKTKLVNPVEITPQIVFYNGVPVFTDIDIETKNIGDGNNNGNQVGCASNLVVSTDINEKINKIAFPKVIYDMAAKQQGIFVWDISLYITNNGIYFGEFCPNRFGYDSIMTEMSMSGGAGKFFESIIEIKNPLKSKFGAAIRLFNLSKCKDSKITFDGIEKDVWLYEVTKKDDEIVSLGSCWDLGVITSNGNSITETIDDLYKTKEKFVFKEVYTRTKNDFKDVYPTSILFRYKEINGNYIEAPDVDYTDKYYRVKLEERINDIKKEKESEIDKIVNEIKSIMDDSEEDD